MASQPSGRAEPESQGATGKIQLRWLDSEILGVLAAYPLWREKLDPRGQTKDIRNKGDKGATWETFHLDLLRSKVLRVDITTTGLQNQVRDLRRWHQEKEKPSGTSGEGGLPDKFRQKFMVSA